MNTIKKTTLIAVITAMAAFAVPSMASAATWKPLNTNKTLTSTSSSRYIAQTTPDYFSFECSSSTLGVHVRTPASSTLDITSASWTGCVNKGDVPCNGSPITVTATGLPWAATTAAGTNVTFTEHLQVSYTGPCGTGVVTVDGPVTGSYNNSTHVLSAATVSGLTPAGMRMYYMGTYFAPIAGGSTTTWHETTNTLNLT